MCCGFSGFRANFSAGASEGKSHPIPLIRAEELGSALRPSSKQLATAGRHSLSLCPVYPVQNLGENAAKSGFKKIKTLQKCLWSNTPSCWWDCFLREQPHTYLAMPFTVPRGFLTPRGPLKQPRIPVHFTSAQPKQRLAKQNIVPLSPLKENSAAGCTSSSFGAEFLVLV